MPDGIFASGNTQMPNMSLMGLLLGGRGYASGWFQQRDRLAMADAAVAKERQNRADFASSMLADPRWKAYLANPNDRASQGNLWGLLYGGPESAANLGNSLLTQGVGALQSRELADLQHQFQSQEQQQAHDFRLLEQTHGTDEAVRQQRLLRQDALQAQLDAMRYVSQPGQNGMTPEQQQMQLNAVGDVAMPGGRKQGYDWVLGPNGGVIGQVPQRGTPERTKIEQTGNAYSNIGDLATKHLWQLENGQMPSLSQWNEDVKYAFKDASLINQGGTMQEGDMAFYSEILAPATKADYFSPDFAGTMKEKLRVLKEKVNRDLHQYAAATLIPENTYSGDDWKVPQNFQPTKPPPQDEFNKIRDRNQQRIEQLSGQGGGPGVLQGQRPVLTITGGGVDRGPVAPGTTGAERMKKQREDLKKRFPKSK